MTVVQGPPAAVIQVFTAARVGRAPPISTEASTNKSTDGRSVPFFALTIALAGELLLKRPILLIADESLFIVLALMSRIKYGSSEADPQHVAYTPAEPLRIGEEPGITRARKPTRFSD